MTASERHKYASMGGVSDFLTPYLHNGFHPDGGLADSPGTPLEHDSEIGRNGRGEDGVAV